MDNTQTNPAHLTVETEYGKAQIRVANEEKVMFFFFPDGSDYALVNRVEHRARIEYVRDENCWKIKYEEIYRRDNTGCFHRYPSDSALTKIREVANQAVNGIFGTDKGKEALKAGTQQFKLRQLEILQGQHKEAREKLEKLDSEISKLESELNQD